jgi:hypothetical protein
VGLGRGRVKLDALHYSRMPAAERSVVFRFQAVILRSPILVHTRCHRKRCYICLYKALSPAYHRRMKPIVSLWLSCTYYCLCLLFRSCACTPRRHPVYVCAHDSRRGGMRVPAHSATLSARKGHLQWPRGRPLIR